MDKPWYQVINAAEVPSPALLVYTERAEENIRHMVELAGGPERLRPHIKTHKMPALIERQLRVGVNKFKCATIAEAEMVARAHGVDILLAMQPVGPNIGRFLKLMRTFPGQKFSTVVDDAKIARQISDEAKFGNQTVTLYIDIDPGMHRSGVSLERAAELFKTVSAMPALKIAGLHAYDGHLHETDLVERTKRCNEAFAPVEKLAMELGVQKIIVGGTPTFPIHAKRGPNVECSPGTVVLSDVGYGNKFPDLDFKVAAAVLTRVVSKPTENRICLDLGHKSIAAENPQPRAEFPEIPDAKAVMHSEEHLVLATSMAPEIEVGRAFYAFPRHICPTVALYSEAVAVTGRVAGDRWPVTARNRILTL
jgi:D-serine deaminase-like pyridoxal phosphate-dependent protein